MARRRGSRQRFIATRRRAPKVDPTDGEETLDPPLVDRMETAATRVKVACIMALALALSLMIAGDRRDLVPIMLGAVSIIVPGVSYLLAREGPVRAALEALWSIAFAVILVVATTYYSVTDEAVVVFASAGVFAAWLALLDASDIHMPAAASVTMALAMALLLEHTLNWDRGFMGFVANLTIPIILLLEDNYENAMTARSGGQPRTSRDRILGITVPVAIILTMRASSRRSSR